MLVIKAQCIVWELDNMCMLDFCELGALVRHRKQAANLWYRL